MFREDTLERVANFTPRPKSPFRSLLNRFRDLFELYVRSAGNKINYLRRKGVRIGQGCQIVATADAFGSEPWLIEIGSRVTIAEGVIFLTHDGASRLFRAQIPQGSRYGNRFGRILIHDECFIGLNSILMPGVEIGPYSIVGVGSLVNKDVPPHMVYAGVPAKPICTVEEYIERYKEKMIPIQSEDRAALRKELTRYFWGEER
jgi:acetyltransferase-like isoleucine patch superfamily enzyme